MKKRFSRAEKWLFGAPVAIFGFVALFLAWRSSTTPESFSTPTPVLMANFLSDGKMLVVRKPHRREDSPSASIYDWHTGKELSSLTLPQQIAVSHSSVSPDGKFCLLDELPRSDARRRTALYDLKRLQVVRSFDELYGSWLDSQHFVLSKREGEQIWKIGSNGELMSQKLDNQPVMPISPDGKWGVEFWSGKPIESTDNITTGSSLSKARFVPNHHTVVSLPDKKKRMKLPGSSWSYLTWQKDSQQLYGVAGLEAGQTKRIDILRFEIGTQKTSSVQLEFPEGIISAVGMGVRSFKFSPNTRLLVGSYWDGSQLIWDATTGKLLKALLENPNGRYRTGQQPEFSLNGQHLLHLSARGVEIYRLDQILPR